jgi:hypothetical protein
MVHAVFRKPGSSPRALWTMAGPEPTSENIWSPVRKTKTREASPKTSGNRSLARMTLPTNRSS